MAGGAGAGAQRGLFGRLTAFLHGRSVRPDAIALRGITPELVQEAAAATDGFSGRELAKLVASMQACALLADRPNVLPVESGSRPLTL